VKQRARASSVGRTTGPLTSAKLLCCEANPRGSIPWASLVAHSTGETERSTLTLRMVEE